MIDVAELIDETAEGDLVIRLHVQPGAGKSAVTGIHGNALKVRVAAPPVDGRANDACVELLARELGVKTGALELVSGQTSREKRVRVKGAEREVVERRLHDLVNPGGIAGNARRR